MVLSASAVLALAASTMLALSFFLGYRLRIASGVDAPAPGSSVITALEYGVILLVLAAAGLTVTDRRIPTPWVLAVTGVAASCLAMMYLSPAEVEPRVALRYAICAALVAISPRVWTNLSPAALDLTLGPFQALLILSVPAYVLDRQYLFPWYNTWGLVAALMLAHALATARTRGLVAQALIVGASLFGVVFSTSRQSVVAVALIALIAILSSTSFSQWLVRLAAATIIAATVIYMLLTSDRLSTIGGLSSNNGRGDLFAAAWGFIQDHPVLGIGSVDLHASYYGTLLFIGQGWSDSAHNLLLDSWIRGGVFGAACFALMILSLLRVPAGLLSPSAYVAVATLPFFLLGSQLLFIEGVAASFVVGLAFGLSQRGTCEPER